MPSDRLAVDENARRTGIATELIEAAKRRANALGAIRLDAMVNVGNAGTIAFWETFGFDFDPDDGRWSLLL